MNIFHDDHLEIIKELLENQVSFLLIGGYAVIFHGYNRTTGDMDLWLEPTNQNKDKFINALEKLGFEPDDLEKLAEMDFTKHLTFSTGEEPQKIDFITLINQVSFEIANDNKVMANFEGMKIPVINADELILSKRNTGRKKDEADVEELQKIIRHKKDF